MERTGHRSLEGVRSYKRTSDRQRRALFDVLNREQPNNQPTTRLATALTEQPAPSCSSGSSSCAFTSQQLRSLSLPSATFSDCNVNFFIGATTMESSRQKRRRASRRCHSVLATLGRYIATTRGLLNRVDPIGCAVQLI